jgi:RNA polymerase sigma-70 factor, ECF subfamily
MQNERLPRAEGARVPPPGPEDEALLRAIAAGDRAALGALYDRHADVLCALARRVLGDVAAAEAALHDVFVEVWHEAAEFAAGATSVRTWLCGKMRTLALRRRAERGAGQGHGAELTLAPSSTGGATASGREGIASLPAELGAVVELAYFEGLAVSDVATRLGLPEALVRQRLVQALAVLRGDSDAKEGRS